MTDEMTSDGACAMRRLLTPRRAALMAALAIAATIGGALVFQYGFGVAPCELCYLQRIPYYVAMPVALLSAFLPNGSRTIRLGLAMLALIFLVNVAFGIYHSGVEWKFWAGPAACSGPAGGVADSGLDLLQQMAQAAVVSCSEASFRFLGLSLAGWSAIISAALVVLVVLPLRCCGTTRRAV